MHSKYAGLVMASVLASSASAIDLDVSDKYIISLKPGVDMKQHMQIVNELHSDALWKRDGNEYGGVSDQYTIGDWQGYAGHFNKSVVDQLKTHDHVHAISDDLVFEEQLDDVGDCCDDGSCEDPKPDESELEEGGPEYHVPPKMHPPREGRKPGQPIPPWRRPKQGLPPVPRYRQPDDGRKPVPPWLRPKQGLQPVPKYRPPGDGGRPAPPRGDPPGVRPSEELVRQRGALWNLGLISHRKMTDLASYWYVKAAGARTYAYLLDSGINPRHQEFEGRVVMGYNALKTGPPTDSGGHGTYMAGIIGGKTVGVAKRTNLVAVKILDTSKTRGSVLLKGLDWAVDDILRQKRERMSVINIPVTTKRDAIINEAFAAATSKGVTVVAPAGNAGTDARNYSPGSAKGVINVGSTDKQRARSPSCNFGGGVKIFAPGDRVCSAWIGGGDKKLKRASGTAGAAAHVSGLVVYFRSFNLLRTQETAWEFMQHVSTKGVVKNVAGSNDLFAYNFSGK